MQGTARHTVDSLPPRALLQILLGGALSSPALAAKLRAAADEGWTPALRVFLPGAGAEAASQGALDFLALTSLKGHTPQVRTGGT